MSGTSLERLRRYADWLDSGIRIPVLGWRIGLESILGLVPGVGDATGAILGGWVVVEAVRGGARPATLIRMLMNLALDAIAGAVPLVGDLFDFVWKANSRNIALLERHQQDPVRAGRADRGFVAVLVIVTAVVCVVPVIGGIYLASRLLGWLAGGP
ncbi:MAG TPA: DUF4112 domain-containing protein [Gemmatimonadales bacterium]|nr:DUF4112 domain-containing protein [Gemmatimonadales bacterium]